MVGCDTLLIELVSQGDIYATDSMILAEAVSASLPTEGMLGLGDGGPAFITTASGSRLAGVAVGQLLNVDYDEETQGRYGAIAIYERVSSHITWIESVINGSE